MDPVVSMLLGNGVVALALALAAMAASRFRRPALAHALWLLVLVKLLTPPVIRVPVVVPAMAAAQQGADAQEPVAENAVASAVAPDVTESAASTSGAVADSAEGATRDPAVATSAPLKTARETMHAPQTMHAPRGVTAVPAISQVAPVVFIAVWVAGSIVWAALLVVRVRRFRAVLKHAMPMEPQLVARVGELARRMGFSAGPDVRVVPGSVVSPMLYWLGRGPTLVFPASLIDGLAPSQFDAIVTHELAHLRRRDHWARAFEVVVTAVLWWHPLVWIARRGLREAEEQCCDAWVVSLLPDSRRTYADTLVDVVNRFAPPARRALLPPGASGLGEFKHLRRRLVMIMSQEGPNRSMSLVGKVFVGLLAASLLVIPTAAAQENGAKPQAAPPPTASANKDEEVKQLRERIAQLEARLEKAEAQLAAATAAAAQQGNQAGAGGGAGAAAAVQPNQVTQAARDVLKRKARARSALDSRKYKPEQLADCEQLYQVANKNWRAPEAIVSLKQMVEKYPDVNRTGCAVLYLGQMSEGDTRAQYLKQAVDKHSECFYFNGVQVGGFARYLLGHYYAENNKPDEAKKLFDEIIAKYPDSITHGGDLLVKLIAQERAKKE
jgi:bla regulator protein BlaR1